MRSEEGTAESHGTLETTVRRLSFIQSVMRSNRMVCVLDKGPGKGEKIIGHQRAGL